MELEDVQKRIPSNTLTSVLFLFLLVFTTSFATFGAAFNEHVASLKLILQWPKLYCTGEIAIKDKGCDEKNIPEDWLIHGLLGYYDTGESIDCTKIQCAKVSVQEFKQLKNIAEGRLPSYWRNLLKRNSNADFWSKQWIKHGCCLGLTLHEYFRLGVDLMVCLERKIVADTLQGIEAKNLTHLFSQKGLKPNLEPQHHPRKFPAAVHLEVGLMTEIDCNKRDRSLLLKKGKHSYEFIPLQLHEISFCIDLNGNFVNCNAEPGNFKIGKCDNKNLPILYPSDPNKPRTMFKKVDKKDEL